jgi:predicted nucleic acid-binding protein
VRFWDSSAVVPLVVAEAETRHCRRLLGEDPEVVVWCLTPVEVISALRRRARDGLLGPADLRTAKAQLHILERAWSEVTSIDRVRELARRLLEGHALRAADALQLAAAITVAEGRPQDLRFVTLDHRLDAAAEREGFPRSRG